MPEKPENNKNNTKLNPEQKEGLLDGLRRGVASLASQTGQFAKDTSEKIKDFAEDGADYIKEKSEDLKERALQAKQELDRRLIRPVTIEDLCKEAPSLPNVIRVFDDDKKMDNEISQGAIGFMDVIGGLKILNVQEKHANELLEADIPDGRASFLPFITAGLYYNDPYLNNRFINLDGYFKYIEKAKLAELDQIAHKLGAKHFKVNLMEERKTFASVKGKQKTRAGEGKDRVGAEASAGFSFNTSERVKIIDENYFTGSDTPEMPELIYFKGNSNIQTLIDMRMSGGIVKKTFYLEYLTNAEFSLDLAKKIDGAIKHYGFESNTTVSSEIEREKRLTFEYIIEF